MQRFAARRQRENICVVHERGNSVRWDLTYELNAGCACSACHFANDVHLFCHATDYSEAGPVDLGRSLNKNIHAAIGV